MASLNLKSGPPLSFGVSWQVVPADISKLFEDAESPGAQRAIEAMMKMKKIDMAALQEAHDSTAAHAGR